MVPSTIQLSEQMMISQDANKNSLCQLPAEEAVSRRMTTQGSRLTEHLDVNWKTELWV